MSWSISSPQAQLQRVQLRLRKSPNTITANVDPKLIKQAVLNLVLNAMQAMPKGGEMILAASNSDSQAKIDVIDTGTGIPPETQAKIFQADHPPARRHRPGPGDGQTHRRRTRREFERDQRNGEGIGFLLSVPME